MDLETIPETTGAMRAPIIAEAKTVPMVNSPTPPSWRGRRMRCMRRRRWMRRLGR